ncbi:Ser-Thr-rich glycosyl-phosphatidyl-inositol-anchored membrane family-domain-containing protein [Podospora australis]|uniref:Ser-Thr-rich glycosyl-phosphatidyl-inositol-anchored membrane family-domain-containing protein n=1 Tax=Podospora australis TaxID=1536484 RepID=A0AAN6X3V4_9PEZI|nr:Ser-Thr-rich glycosyl-phosphatidyl-inositol-anchored membrane family-domain-containing protein [Podospora australis]
MRFSAASLLAFASVVLAQTEGFNVITKPAKGEKVAAGKPYSIVWSPDATNPGAVTLELYGGPADNLLNKVETIDTGVDGADGTYAWVVDSALGTEKVYGIKLILESNTTIWQWGNPFAITSGGASSSSASVSASTSATSIAESSTSTKISTVTSTTAPVSSKETSTTFSRISSSSIYHGNSTHTTEATSTTFVTGTTSTGTATSSTSPAVVTNGVAAMGASSFALLGGVAMAVLAL